MKKLLIMIFACLIFIPIANASITFEEIKAELEKNYGNRIKIEGDLNSGIITLDSNYEKEIIINDDILIFDCHFMEDNITNDLDEFNQKLDKVNLCNRYNNIIQEIADYILKKNNYEQVKVSEEYYYLYYNGYLHDTGEIVYENDNGRPIVSKFTLQTVLDLNEFKPADNTVNFNANLTSDNKVKITVKTNNPKIEYCYIYKSIDNENYKLLKYMDCSKGAEFTDDDVNLDLNTYYYKANLNIFFNATTIDKYLPFSDVIKISSLKDDTNNNTTNTTTNTTTNNTTDNTINNTVTNTVEDNEETNENANNISDNSTASSDTEKNPETGSFLSIISVIILFAFMVGITIYTGRKKYLWRI